jgi:hypothetical protein
MGRQNHVKLVGEKFARLEEILSSDQENRRRHEFHEFARIQFVTIREIRVRPFSALPYLCPSVSIRG